MSVRLLLTLDLSDVIAALSLFSESYEIPWRNRCVRMTQPTEREREEGGRGGDGAFVLTVCCQPLLYAGRLCFLRLPHSTLDLAGQKER